MVSQFDLTIVRPDANGVFHLLLPGFAQDAVTKSYKLEGTIQLVAREQKTWNILSFLTPINVEARAGLGQVRVRPDFPREIVFDTRAP